jgi:hypothetical protein
LFGPGTFPAASLDIVNTPIAAQFKREYGVARHWIARNVTRSGRPRVARLAGLTYEYHHEVTLAA